MRQEKGPGGPGIGSDQRAETSVQRKASGIAGKSTRVEHAYGDAVQRRAAPGGDGADPAHVHADAERGVSGAGASLPHLDRIQGLFGPRHDLSGVQAHTGGAAASACDAIGAGAYATGNHVAFAGPPSLHTAAHEAAHVVQQRSGVQLKGGVGSHGDEYERHADAVADRVVAGQSAADLLPSTGVDGANGRGAVQRDGGGPTGVTDPKAIIPVANLIGYIESVERAYPTESPTDILTRIRLLYYGGGRDTWFNQQAFGQLIPGANSHDIIPTYSQAGPIILPRDPSRALVDAQNPDAYSHLTARADENGRGDNPSPYILLSNGERIDLGHLLLGLDALVHPRTSTPYSDYGVPNIDPASFVADLGIGAVWMTQHEESGSPPGNAPRQLSTPSLDEYYRMSAPTEDLLGDADSFGMQETFNSGAVSLSQAMRTYYLGSSGAAPVVNRRWQSFCARSGLTYTRSGGAVTWGSGVRPMLITRVNTFNDLYGAGGVGSVWGSIFGPSRRSGGWPHTPAVVDRFLDWVQPRLQAELASSGGGGGGGGDR
jgi:Domain of unknown function (DUF4157)